MINSKLTGMGVAMITPFKEDDSVDYKTLERLVDYQIKSGTDYLVVLGTTAETPTLTDAEKKEVSSFILHHVNGRIPVVLGVGGNCTRAVADELLTRDFTGVDAILSITPYYNKPSQEGLYQHYSTLVKQTDLPIILYNVPGRTGVNLTAETTLRLANDFSKIIAIKDASGIFSQVNEIIKKKPSHFSVISGDDGMAFPLITMGAIGVISVIGNAFPKEFSQMVRLALAGDYAKALEIHHSYTDLFNLLLIDGNPAGVKCLLHTMGLAENKLRLPLVPPRAVTCEQIHAVLDELNITY